MHTVLTRLAGMLKRSLEGTSKYLLEKLNVCGRDLLRWIHALQRAGGRMQRYGVISIKRCSNSLHADSARVLQPKHASWRVTGHATQCSACCLFHHVDNKGTESIMVQTIGSI